MKFSEILAVILVNVLAHSPCYADTSVHPTNLEWSVLTQQLENTEKEINTLNLKIEDMAKDIKEIKECSKLARQPPLTLDWLRENIKPSNKADDMKLIEMVKSDAASRFKCGLPLK